MEMTFTEMREQILANAMRLFPKAVEEYLAKHNVYRAKPEDIFDIETLRVGNRYTSYPGERGWIITNLTRAVLSYGSPTERKTAITAPRVLTRHEAIRKLLVATEDALAVVNDVHEAWGLNDIETAARAGGYVVDEYLLLHGFTSTKEPITQLGYDQRERGYDF